MEKPTWKKFLVQINDIETIELKATSEETLRWAIKILHPSPIYKLSVTDITPSKKIKFR